MSDLWLPLSAVLVAAVFVVALVARRKRPEVSFTDQREERLARRVAALIGCTPSEALPAVRNELAIAPNQSDETLTKRATYHYRESIPETQCRTYRDPKPG